MAGLGSKFLEELKRRNLVRVGILYLIACWLVLEPTHVVFHMLEVPAWANRLVVLLMAIGFPLVLLFSWIYEVTPQGLKLTSEVDPAQSITHRTGRRLDRAIIAVLSVAVLYLVVDKFWLSAHSPSGSQPDASGTSTPAAPAVAKALAANDKSIAVLPFTDMSEKRDQEYFSDGLSEELIDHLSHSPDLKVIARTSSFQFKGKSEDIRTIAGKLGVTHLLEGSVRKDGNVLRITAQLIRASDGTHLWSQTYERNVSGIFKLQDEIAGTVAGALRAALVNGNGAQREAANAGAYNAVLRGKYFLRRRTKEDTERALAAFREAIRLDPTCAVAWAQVSHGYNQLGVIGWLPPQEAYAQAKKAVDRALALDPNLAEAHHSLAAISWNFKFDYATAHAEDRRSRELDPGGTAAFMGAFIDAVALGRTAEAVPAARRLVERDPLNIGSQQKLAFALLEDDRLDEAEKVARATIELDPGAGEMYSTLSDILLAQQRADAALSAAGNESDEGARLQSQADALWALGRHAESDAAIRELETRFSATQAYWIAESYALRGDKKAAFEWLDRAFRNREAQLTIIRSDRSFRSLREEPRYHALLVKMKLNDESLLATGS